MHPDLKTVNEALQLASGKLAGKKGPDKDRKGNEVPSKAKKNPAANNEWDRHVDGQQPLG